MRCFVFVCSYWFFYIWVVILCNDDSMVCLIKEDVLLDVICCNKKFSVFLMILLCDDLEWGFLWDIVGVKNLLRILLMNSLNSKWLVLYNE